jgi:hypothetical protein
MIIITLLGTALNETVFINKGNWLLAAINGITFILALWIIIEGCKTLVKKKAIQE